MGKNIRKIDDTELEDVSGGLIVMNDLIHREGENITEPQNTIMSGDTNVDPMLLGRKGPGIKRNKTPEVGRITGQGKEIVNTGGQWA
ncbi:MAG: hypothetical protein IJU87_06410 [Lachnospiraceae bacterium]|nr:hypothetical protein [Lachnospiraceae bacterium]